MVGDAGRNPPFVQVDGIRLNGLPAPSRRQFIDAYLPFHLAGQPFHRFQISILNDLTRFIVTD